MTPETIAHMINPTEEYCTRCDEPIKGEPVIRDAEANAPYQPAPYCSAECAQFANEDAFEHATEAQ